MSHLCWPRLCPSIHFPTTAAFAQEKEAAERAARGELEPLQKKGKGKGKGKGKANGKGKSKGDRTEKPDSSGGRGAGAAPTCVACPEEHVEAAEPEDALGSLIAAYGDDEDVEDGVTASPERTAGESSEGGSKRKKKPCRYWLNGKCRHGDKCTFLHPEDRHP